MAENKIKDEIAKEIIAKRMSTENKNNYKRSGQNKTATNQTTANILTTKMQKEKGNRRRAFISLRERKYTAAIINWIRKYGDNKIKQM